jgi:Family of unknown function (DUF5999)
VNLHNPPAGSRRTEQLSPGTRVRVRGSQMRWIVCSHEPQCPSAGHTARSAAHVIAAHPEQGWSLLCNGIVLFDDGGLLLLNGRAEAPHRRPFPVIAA